MSPFYVEGNSAFARESGFPFESYTYLSAIEARFRNRRFPVEIITPGRYENQIQTFSVV